MARPPRKPGNGPSRRPSAYRPRVAGRGRSSAAGDPQTPEPTETPETTGTPEGAETSPVDAQAAESADAEVVETTEAAESTDVADNSAESADAAEKAEAADTTDAAETTEAAETTAGTGPSLEKSDSDVAEARPTAKTRRVARVSTIKPNTAASQSSTTPVSTDQGSKPRRGASPSSFVKLSRRTLTVLGIITGVLAIAAIVLAVHPGATIGSNKAFIDQAATSELVSQAQTKVCTANSANGTKFDEWSNNARSGLTGEALAQFNKQVAPLKQVMEQAKATTDCQIDAIGVRDLTGSGDGSRAVIVVNMILSGTQNGVPTQSLTPRYQVNMEKHGDSWLIAKVADI